MQADDLVGLVAGGSTRRGLSRFLRPLSRGISENVITTIREKFTNKGGEEEENEEIVAEEAQIEADNESEAEEAEGRRKKIQSFLPHCLFFLYILGVTFNFAAEGYSVARKACLAQNTTDDFCRLWKPSNISEIQSSFLQSESFQLENPRLHISPLNLLPPGASQQNLLNERLNNSLSQDLPKPMSSSSNSIGHSPNVINPISILDSILSKHHHKKRSSQAEETTELYVFYQGLVAFIPPAILVLIFASCCDEFSSFRLPLSVSIIGAIITTGANFALSFFPELPLIYDILTPLVEAIFGGFPLALMCIYVMTALSVPTKKRTTAFFLLQIAFLLAFSVGRLITAILVNNTQRTLSPYIIALIILPISLGSLLVSVDRVDLEGEVEERRRRQQHHTSNNDPVLLSSRLFSHHHIFSSVRGLVSERVRGSRYELLFLVACVFFLVATTRSSISGFFLDANPDTIILDSIVIIVALLLIIPLFIFIIRALPFDSNISITIIGVAFLFIGQSLQFATNNPALNHVRQVLHLISNIAPAGIRAHVGTLVERKEYGKAYGALAACESIAPLVGSALRKFLGHGLGQLPVALILMGGLGFLGYHELRKRMTTTAATEVLED